MTTPPLVSIVTPVLNRAGSIRACLASVSAQTYPNVEHIVVDGGSTDGTIETVEAFESFHALRWISEPDGGMYEAVNKGLRLARGTLLAYVNSDDMYLPWSVEVAAEQLSRGADLVFGDMGLLTRGWETFRPKFYRPFDLNYYTHFETIGQPTVFWSSEVTKRLGDFDTSYQLIGDCEYWLRAAVAGYLWTHVHEILAIQVEHPGTLRHTRPNELNAEFRRLRTTYTAAAGPPAPHEITFIRQGLRWRVQQIYFGLESLMSAPARWPRFLAFLRQHGIKVNRRRLIWYLLPGRYWPRDLSTIDVELFERRLTVAMETRPR
jgi:GT2 family glycosyltransferase